MSFNIYKENILDLYKNPHNNGILKSPTHEGIKNNSFCGDKIKIQLVIKNNRIKKISFFGDGCAISTASASLFTDKIKEMNLEDAEKISEKDILKMLNIPI